MEPTGALTLDARDTAGTGVHTIAPSLVLVARGDLVELWCQGNCAHTGGVCPLGGCLRLIAVTAGVDGGLTRVPDGVTVHSSLAELVASAAAHTCGAPQPDALPDLPVG